MTSEPSAPPPEPADFPPAVLARFPGDNPAGRDVRYEGDYDLITEARRDENPALSQGVWVRDLKRADWRATESLCLETLGQRSKDLRVACWLAEAWVHLDGFSGLRRGVALIDELCARFWDDLFPRIESGDLSARMAPLEWLNQRLPVALRLWPVVVNAAKTDEHFTWADYIDAQRLETVRLRDRASAQKAENQGSVTLAKFELCQKQTPTGRLEGMAVDLERAMAQLTMLDNRLTERCGRDAPGLGKIRAVAEEIAAFLAGELAARRPNARGAAAGQPILPPPSAPTPPPAEPAAAPMTRALAYQRLGEIADFLLESDPQSPTPYVLRRMADWGALPLPEFIRAFEDAGGDLMLLLRSLGLGDEVEPAEYENKGEQNVSY